MGACEYLLVNITKQKGRRRRRRRRRRRMRFDG